MLVFAGGTHLLSGLSLLFLLQLLDLRERQGALVLAGGGAGGGGRLLTPLGGGGQLGGGERKDAAQAERELGDRCEQHTTVVPPTLTSCLLIGADGAQGAGGKK